MDEKEESLAKKPDIKLYFELWIAFYARTLSGYI